jgi:hypothetical protein
MIFDSLKNISLYNYFLKEMSDFIKEVDSPSISSDSIFYKKILKQ